MPDYRDKGRKSAVDGSLGSCCDAGIIGGNCAFDKGSHCFGGGKVTKGFGC